MTHPTKSQMLFVLLLAIATLTAVYGFVMAEPEYASFTKFLAATFGLLALLTAYAGGLAPPPARREVQGYKGPPPRRSRRVI